MRLDRFAILGLKNCILVDLWQKSSERNNDLPINDINYPTPTDLADIICVTLVMILWELWHVMVEKIFTFSGQHCHHCIIDTGNSFILPHQHSQCHQNIILCSGYYVVMGGCSRAQGTLIYTLKRLLILLIVNYQCIPPEGSLHLKKKIRESMNFYTFIFFSNWRLPWYSGHTMLLNNRNNWILLEGIIWIIL